MKEETGRQKKFAKEILKELSQLLQREVEPLFGCLITLTNVRTTSDLQTVRAYLTTLPDSKMKEVLFYLEDNNKQIRYSLAKKIKNTVRVMPTLEFYEDDTMKEVNKIEDLFQKINPIQPEETKDSIDK